jgi:poly(A) polymerase
MLRRLRKLLRLGDRKTSSRDDAAPPPNALRPVAPEAVSAPVHHGPRVVHHPIPSSDLDPDALKIFRRLTRFDHTAYFVGGCVRDLLLGRKPKDFDIATSATPRQVKRLFGNCRIIGRRFRLAHIYFQNGKIIEVATFRARDGGDGDDDASEGDLLIREDNVFGTPEEDALRRDFTINALFYDANSGNVVDHADGLGDLRRQLVRTIGDADIRFREDPIRILRAIKFAARLDFSIEGSTLQALRRTCAEIPRAAPPRILEEVLRFARGGATRRSFELMFDTGAFAAVLPELEPGYARDPSARGLLLRLLEHADLRRSLGKEIGAGEIFSALVLPLLVPGLGWGSSATPAIPQVPQVREMVDELLRPIALRLRVSRRDQEHCRQILQALSRMAFPGTLRRGHRQAIQKRPVFEDACWMLSAAGKELGGAIAEAAGFWMEAPAVVGTEPHHAEKRPPGQPDAEEVAERGRGRRRRRRHPRPGGARPGAGDAQGDRQPAAAEPRREARAKMPAPWDDDYFFAALPSAPRLDEEDPASDRYGADRLAASIGAAEGIADSPSKPPPRRRRRRRRRRPSGSPPPTENRSGE